MENTKKNRNDLARAIGCLHQAINILSDLTDDGEDETESGKTLSDVYEDLCMLAMTTQMELNELDTETTVLPKNNRSCT